jgi:hypothetical protein
MFRENERDVASGILAVFILAITHVAVSYWGVMAIISESIGSMIVAMGWPLHCESQ